MAKTAKKQSKILPRGPFLTENFTKWLQNFLKSQNVVNKSCKEHLNEEFDQVSYHFDKVYGQKS